MNPRAQEDRSCLVPCVPGVLSTEQGAAVTLPDAINYNWQRSVVGMLKVPYIDIVMDVYVFVGVDVVGNRLR